MRLILLLLAATLLGGCLATDNPDFRSSNSSSVSYGSADSRQTDRGDSSSVSNPDGGR